MSRTRQTYEPVSSRRRNLLATAATTVGAGLVAVAVVGVTSALWRTELTSDAALQDAAVLFAVNGEEASASDPTVGVDLGSAEIQALLDDGAIAVPIEVQALSQGNRGLRYSVAVPTTDEGNILHWADLAVFPVDGMNACTVDAAAPLVPPTTSTPVSADYSDETTPATEYWCFRADLRQLPDVGEFTTTATVTGAHALGEIVETPSTQIDVTTAFTAANEPTHRVTFTYETFRAGTEQ